MNDMKVVCVYNKYYEKHLTISKTYGVIRIGKLGNYIIIDEKGKEDWYPMEYFKPLSEIRNEKIERLLA